MEIDDDGPPALPVAVSAALDRLAAAVTRLKATTARNAGARASQGERDTELALMSDDRARLAGELDAALARELQLRRAHARVADGIGRAESAVASALRRIASEQAAPEPEEEEQPPLRQRGARAGGEAR